MRVFSILWLVGLVGVLAISAAPVLAQSEVNDDDIRVLEQRGESQFPEGVRFFIEAESPDPIDDIRVYFKKIGQTNRSSYRAVEFEPGTRITGDSLIRSGGNEYIPPGTRIAYTFELRDTAGRVRRTEEQVVVYLDGRFDWQTMSQGPVTVFYQGAPEEATARIVLESASFALDRMGPILGIAPRDPLHIVTYSNYAFMAEALPFRSRATEEQLITEGMAFSEERVLLVYSHDSSVRSTSSHEFTHLLVADAVGRAIPQVPTWLNEGLAEYANVDPDPSFASFLQRAIDAETLRPLRFQGTFSGTPEEIITAYGQGASVVRYLIDTYGGEKMAELMVAITRTLDIDEALRQVYGFDQHGLDTEWRLSMGLEPFPAPEELVSPQPTVQPQAATQEPEAAPTDIAPVVPTTDGAEPAAPAGSTGCAAPLSNGQQHGDLAMLLLLMAPLGMLWRRNRMRRE